jgi:hypothetical protein
MQIDYVKAGITLLFMAAAFLMGWAACRISQRKNLTDIDYED